MSNLIAVVEDEPDIVSLLTIHLKKAGYPVRSFLTAQAFFAFLREETPDLILLDLMLPDADGLDICKYVRQKEQYAATRIIMLTARTSETDTVIGLELGADDYITKPFSPKELVARVKAVLRRKAEDGPGDLIEVGTKLRIDKKKYEVALEDNPVDLTATEFKILLLLSSRKGWVFSREQILDYLWGDDKAVLSRTVDVHIKNLREKLGEAKEFIRNVRGIGYKLEE